ncbi:MAG: hypothetical protein ABI460_03725 [Caldimonas sp.]
MNSETQSSSLTAVASAAERTGLEDVLTAVRQLARQTRGLAEDAAGIVERELATALSVAESLRDKVISAKALEQARAHPLLSRVRADAHRAVDIGMDAVATGYVFGVELVEAAIDRPRAALTGRAG